MGETDHFYIFLRQKRLEKGLSQKEVAAQLGYSTSQFVSNWERGLASPPLYVLRVLADLYGLDRNEIFDRVLKDMEAEARRKFFGNGAG